MDNNNYDFHHIKISKRHVGPWSVFALAMVVIIFLSGYFLGKRVGFEKISQKMEHESLADQIYASLYSCYDSNGADESDPVVEKQEELSHEEKKVSLLEEKSFESMDVPEERMNDTDTVQVGAPLYFAQLIGYGSYRQAEAFASRWIKKGIMLEVVKRSSKSAKGNVRYWYQVITPEYQSKIELEQWVNRISHQEKLHDVHIVST